VAENSVGDNEGIQGDAKMSNGIKQIYFKHRDENGSPACKTYKESNNYMLCLQPLAAPCFLKKSEKVMVTEGDKKNKNSNAQRKDGSCYVIKQAESVSCFVDNKFCSRAGYEKEQCLQVRKK
jgi:hypothetical protein